MSIQTSNTDLWRLTFSRFLTSLSWTSTPISYILLA